GMPGSRGSRYVINRAGGNTRPAGPARLNSPNVLQPCRIMTDDEGVSLRLPPLHRAWLRMPVLLLAGAAIAPAVVVLPSTLPGGPEAHPVAPRTAMVPLSGVDGPALRSLRVPSVRARTGGPARPRATTGPPS